MLLGKIRHNAILLFLALLAMGVVIGAAVHVHHDDGALDCWLCIAAVGLIGATALIFVTIDERRVLSVLAPCPHLLPSCYRLTHDASRAPPLMSGIPTVQ